MVQEEMHRRRAQGRKYSGGSYLSSKSSVESAAVLLALKFGIQPINIGGQYGNAIIDLNPVAIRHIYQKKR